MGPFPILWFHVESPEHRKMNPNTQRVLLRELNEQCCPQINISAVVAAFFVWSHKEIQKLQGFTRHGPL